MSKKCDRLIDEGQLGTNSLRDRFSGYSHVLIEKFSYNILVVYDFRTCTFRIHRHYGTCQMKSSDDWPLIFARFCCLSAWLSHTLMWRAAKNTTTRRDHLKTSCPCKVVHARGLPSGRRRQRFLLPSTVDYFQSRLYYLYLLWTRTKVKLEMPTGWEV